LKTKTWKIIAITISITVVAAALLTSAAYAYMGGFASQYGGPYGGYGGMMGSGGMMGGYGYYPQSTDSTQPNATSSYYGGGGCGYNGNAYASPTNGTSSPLNITTAETIANNYLASRSNPDLAVKEIEEYSQNFYVQYYEKSTGIGAFEMLIDKNTGAIYPEMGPNMMWNTKYGMMSGSGYGGMMGAGGMMGGYGYGYTETPTTNMPVNSTQASADAQQWLNSNIAGATVGEVTPFYGYYHVMVQLNGNTYGMLSVNGYTGQVWYHTWHGTFIQALDLR
jgi:hypothetical protein